MFYLILLYFSSVGSCIENFVMLELRQSFQAEYHDGEEDDEDWDDCHDSGMLAGLGVLKQQPNFALEVVCRKGFFFLLDESFIFPEIKQILNDMENLCRTLLGICNIQHLLHCVGNFLFLNISSRLRIFFYIF